MNCLAHQEFGLLLEAEERIVGARTGSGGGSAAVATAAPERKARIYYDKDADPAMIRDRRVAVIGYGSQGHAHALNLKDCGVDVAVALRTDSRRRDAAGAAGFAVLSPENAVEWADVIVFLAPDTDQAVIYREQVLPRLRPGQMLMFAHGREPEMTRQTATER